MWQYMLGFISGVYVGTYYNCKPVIENLTDYIKQNLPKENAK